MINTDGAYTCAIKNKARLIKSKNGTYGIEIVLSPTEHDDKLQWVGWLSEKAKVITFRTLSEVLESDGSDDVDADGFFTSAKFLNYEKKYVAVVEMEEVLNSEGSPVLYSTGEIKMRPKVKWINNLGGSNYEGVKVTEAKSVLGKLNFKALIKKKSSKSLFNNQDDEFPF